jgi:hypothetical protein
MELQTFVWVRTTGVIIAVGETVDKGIENLVERFGTQALDEVYHIRQMGTGYIDHPTFILNESRIPSSLQKNAAIVSYMTEPHIIK